MPAVKERSTPENEYARPPSRTVRRRIERRADRLLANLCGALSPNEADPREYVLLLSEESQPLAVRRDRLGPALARCGVAMPDLPEMLAAIAADPRDDGSHFPAIVRVDRWVQ